MPRGRLANGFGTRHRHGLNGTRVHKAWSGMRQRCENPNNDKFKWYGGRGIKVCDRWQIFENFLADMGEPPARHSLDRKDVNGNYELNNCRWADKLTQANNTRANARFVIDGHEMTLAEASRAYGIKIGTAWRRMRVEGWDAERAFKTPLMPQASRRGADRVG